MIAILEQTNQLLSEFQHNLPITLNIIILLWVIHTVNMVFGYRLNVFGIYPRHPIGLIGIVCSPFLHGSFNHIFFNSIPLFIFLNLILLSGVQVFIIVSLTIMLVAGILVWIVGRKGFHVGASGVIMGYWAYLLVDAFHRGTAVAIILGFVSLFYFGGLVIYLLPNGIGESWEGHLAGFLAGLLSVYSTSWILMHYPNLF